MTSSFMSFSSVSSWPSPDVTMYAAAAAVAARSAASLSLWGSDSRSGSDKRTGSSCLQRFLPFARARFDFTLAVVVHSYGMHAGNIRNRGHERDPSIRRLNIVERQPHTSAPGLMRGFDFVHVAANLGAWRERGPVRADCSSLVPTLIESEPFGYVKGAFTGAVHAKMDDGIGRQ
jgi:hypothetical protein